MARQGQIKVSWSSLSTLKALFLSQFHWVSNAGLEERVFKDDLLGHPLLSPAIRGNMFYCGFCDCDKERMSHTSLLDTRPLIDTVQVAFLRKGNDGILRQLAVGKGWSGLFSGIRGEWQASSVRCWEFKGAAEKGFSHRPSFSSALP